MRTVKLLSLVLIVAIPWLVSCQDGGFEADHSIPFSPVADAGKNIDERNAYLRDLWERSEEMTYEIAVRAVFDPKVGCEESGIPESWEASHPDYVFKLDIPSQSLEADLPEEVTVTISVPTLESIEYVMDRTQAMPIERTVDALVVFDPPALLTISFHPRLRPTCAAYCFFGLEPDDVDPDVFYVNNLQDVISSEEQASKRLPDPSLPLIEDPVVKCATGIQVEIPCFSNVGRPDRWHVVNGCCGRGGIPVETPCDWTD
jgi:hypothetical protein